MISLWFFLGGGFWGGVARGWRAIGSIFRSVNCFSGWVGRYDEVLRGGNYVVKRGYQKQVSRLPSARRRRSALLFLGILTHRGCWKTLPHCLL